MISQDPRMNPNTADVVGSSELKQPYARRAIKAVLGFALALLIIGAFVGWYFFTPSDDGTSNNNTSTPQQQTLATQMPGNDYDQGSGRSSIYNFFYKVFGGIDDGLEDSPHNLNNVEHIDQMNIDTAELFNDEVSPTLNLKKISERRANALEAMNQDEYRHSVHDILGSDVYGRKGDKAGRIFDILVHKETGKARAIIVREGNVRYERDLTALRFKRVLKQSSEGDVVMTISEEKIEDKPDFRYASLEDTNYISLQHLRDGQLIDFEGNVTGQVDAVIYENAEAQNIYFTLRPILAREGISKFQLPFEEINIVESADGYDVKLTKEQTIALAKTLFTD